MNQFKKIKSLFKKNRDEITIVAESDTAAEIEDIIDTFEDKLQESLESWNVTDSRGNTMLTSYELSAEGPVVNCDLSNTAKNGPATYSRTFNDTDEIIDILNSGKLENQLIKGRSLAQALNAVGFKRS